HVTPLAAPAVAKYPALRATGCDTQIERAAIAVVAALPDALHPYCRKPSEHARHVSVAHHHAHHEEMDVGIHRPPNIDGAGCSSLSGRRVLWTVAGEGERPPTRKLGGTPPPRPRLIRQKQIRSAFFGLCA